MRISASDNLNFDAARLMGESAVARGRFNAMLADAQGSQAGESDRAGEARHAAEQLVAGTLVLPILQQMREDPFRTDMFHGGFAEDAFGAQLDTELADRIVKGTNMNLVDVIFNKMNAHNRLNVKA